VEAMAFPHKTAPYPNLRKAVALPAPKSVTFDAADAGPGTRRPRRRRALGKR